MEHTEAGRIPTGFSAPYVGLYNNAGGAITYTGGRRLARGVDVKLNVNPADDNVFYADNQAAESEGGTFSDGTVDLTTDAPHTDAERLIYGLPDPEPFSYGENKTVNLAKYGDNAKPPYVGIGYVIEFQSGGKITYQSMILPKAKFLARGIEAKTREGQKNWQTQTLTANILRDDTDNHNWQIMGDEVDTEAEAIAILEAFLGVGKEA